MNNQPKATPINIRCHKQQRDIIDRAAAIKHKSRTEFVLDVSCREAENIILAQTELFLSKEEFQAFEDLISQPVSENKKLHKLMSRQAPWE